MKKKILYFVFRNTSTLDYGLPVICELKKKYKDYDITVLYCTYNKTQIIRDAKYYNEMFNKFDITAVDYGDLISVKSNILKRLLKFIFSVSSNDVIGIKSFFKNPFFMFGKNIKYILHSYRKKIENFIINKYLKMDHIIENINPNLILFDHRGKNKIFLPQEDIVYNFIERKNIKVVLIPHANHALGETDEFHPFGIGNKKFPNFCDQWIASNYAKPYLLVDKKQRNQFDEIGYPGVDSSWINSIIRKNNNKMNILIITRRISAKGYPENADDDIIVNYMTFVKYVKTINSTLKEVFGNNFNLILKPHPSSSYPEILRALKDAEIENYDISYEPFYELLSFTDLVVTEFTTAIAFPVLYKIPVILIYTPLLDSIYKQWDVCRDLYGELSSLIYSIEELEKTIKTIINSPQLAEKDYLHFRKFYPDGAMQRAVDRSKYLLKEV